MNNIDRNLARLDLNLLTALNALLHHRSVSAAADAVGRTQSAMSHSLARLRAVFQDALLVRDGWAMRPTPLAEALQPRVTQAAQGVAALFDPAPPFHPATSTRRLRLAVPDLCAPLLSPLIAAVAAEAPGMQVDFVSASTIRRAVLTLEADVGLVFGRPKPDTALAIRPLAPLTWCTFAPRDHAYAKSPTPAEWQAAHHIVVGTADAAPGPVESAQNAAGLSRRVLCHAPNFNAALALAAACDALFTTLEGPVATQARQLGLIPSPPPFPMADASAALVLHADFGDPFRRWMQALCHRVLRTEKSPARKRGSRLDTGPSG